MKSWNLFGFDLVGGHEDDDGVIIEDEPEKEPEKKDQGTFVVDLDGFI